MDTDVKQTTDFYDLMAWFQLNRKLVTWISSGVLALAILIGGYVWHGNYAETQASDALSEVKLPVSSTESGVAGPADPQPYLQVAADYSGTSAASRALLIAGQIQFDAGKFDQSGKTFQQFLQQYPDNPLASQAMIGVAASLEAQGRIPEATARYNDLITQHPSDPTVPQAKSALARLYIEQNKPEMALRLYEEMGRANNNDSWTMEAGIQLQELLAKYPNLRKPVTPPPPASSSASPTITLPK